MQNNKEIFVIIALFLFGVLAVFFVRIWQVKLTEKKQFISQKSQFTLKPPRKALSGKITELTGKVEKESRDEEEFKEMERKEKIVEGDKLKTAENGRAKITFTDFLQAAMTSETEVSLSNLQPKNFLIYQTKGEVRYKLLQKKNPVSVRSLHTLIGLSEGEAELSIEGQEITLRMIAGKAKIAIVDLENNTHIYNVKEDEQAIINDRDREVEIEQIT